MSKEAIEHYEAALKEAFPSGATGDVFHHWNETRKALAEQPAQQLPVGVGGGLVAIKTLLSRDPCAHAKVAIEMIDAMLSEQPAQQEPVAFYVYKPTLPRGNLGSVSDSDLPWVYDQDPSSGFSARMLVTPITSPPASKPWVGLTDDEILYCVELENPKAIAEEVEVKLKEKNT